MGPVSLPPVRADDGRHPSSGLGQIVLDGPALVVRALHVGPIDNVAYLLTSTATGAQALVDAAAEPDLLLALAAAHGDGRLALVVTTHRHHDHVGALAAVVGATGATVAGGDADADAIEEATGVRVGRRLAHGDVVALGGTALEVVALRGHTLGSVTLAHGPSGAAATADATVLLTGDSLFPGGVGNTQRDPERFATLLADVRERLFDRHADALVLPGHGAPTTLAAERPHLGEWAARGW